MRLTLIGFIFLATSLFACPNGCGNAGSPMMGKSCHQKMYRPGSTLGTLKYALHIMQLNDEPDIKVAIHGYKRTLMSLPRGMNTDAFKAGKFDKELYIKNSRKQQKLAAEIDLFETIYLVLDDKQKEELHRLMAAHQHYLSLNNCSSGQGCGVKNCHCPSCNCSTKPDCNTPMKGKGCN